MKEGNNITNRIILFGNEKVRSVWHNGQHYLSVSDVVYILTNSTDVKQYIKKMKGRDHELSVNWGTICTLLDVTSKDGKEHLENMANHEGILRIIQSIPSSKSEPFKRWLAKLGKDRLDEIQDPELATRRTRAMYKSKGYSDSWIEKRMRGIAIREELTDEWKNRGATEQRDYEILTAEISKATFGVTPSEYKELKGLERENLRDHMDDFELIFNMLGERSTTEIHRNEDSKGLSKLKSDAQIGGDIAGGARKKLEEKLGRSVVSKKNFLTIKENNKLRGKGKE